jgi:hypothetical protein
LQKSSSRNSSKACIIYSFVSDATKRSPLVGMQRIYDLAHKHAIPVNWVVNLTTVKRLGAIIQRFHEENEDELIFQLESDNTIFDNPGMEKKRPKYETITDVTYFRNLIKKQSESIRTLMPWAKLNIADFSIKTPTYLKALKEEGFKGIWGICWNYKNFNGVNDYGAPFGIYKIGADYRIPLAPATVKEEHSKESGNQTSKHEPLIAFERTFRDINRSFHTGKPDLFCSETDLIQYNKICTPDNVKYWKNLIQEYISNLQYNDQLFLVQHEPAHNMEFTVNNYDTRLPVRIEESLRILDNYFAYISKIPQIRIKKISDALIAFQELETVITPKYTIFRDHPIPSMEYQKEIRTNKFIMKHHLGTLTYALKKIIGKADSSKKPVKWPANGKNFSALFVFQNELGQLYFELESLEKSIVRPVKQIRYVNNQPTDKKNYPIISNYRITPLNEQNRTDLELEIKVLENTQWGILLKGNYREFEIYDQDMKVDKYSVANSAIFPKFVFLCFFLKNNIPNRYIINLYNEN